MTDKTDIAALTRPVRDRYDWSNAVWRDCDQCGKQHTGTVTAEDGSQICAHCADQLYWSAWQVLAERALDQLEAERRKGDLWFGKVADLEAALKAERQRADALQTERDEFRRRLKIERSILEDADKELAALKGDQVPVALVDERRGSGGFCLTQYGRRLNLQHGTELFTAPQKPVVLHDHANSDLVFSYKCPGCGSRPVIKHAGDCTHYNVETVEESEPAGGIVKDGE